MSDNKEIQKDLLKQLQSVNQDFKGRLNQVEKNCQLDSAAFSQYTELEVEYLGKKSPLNSVLAKLQKIENPELKKEIGAKANQIKTSLTQELTKSKQNLQVQLWKDQMLAEAIDFSRPGLRTELATSHIVSQTVARIEDIFLSMGFGVEYPYEADNAYNTFDVLNIPESHPARDNWDTLWLSDGNLAIPHTSAMQNRIIRANELPISKVIIGKTFRNEATDVRHEHTFTQVEGVYLASKSNIGELVGTLLEFFENFFGRKLKYKFSPDFFPFTEPGAQMAIECLICDSKGCKVCKGSGYLEVIGCGMVHPKVIAAAGKDPERCKGFAWGMGVERLILIEQQINDIRNFYSNNLKFTKQFP